jgi:hypothetical protein
MAKTTTITTLDDEVSPDVKTPTKQAPKVSAAEVRGSNSDDALSGKKALLTIHPTETEGGSDAVVVSLNGYAYQIPRGKPFLVPVEVVHILDNAVTTTYHQTPQGVIEKHNKRFPYSVEPAPAA